MSTVGTPAIAIMQKVISAPYGNVRTLILLHINCHAMHHGIFSENNHQPLFDDIFCFDTKSHFIKQHLLTKEI